MPSIEETFKPLADIGTDISLTFAPYHAEHGYEFKSAYLLHPLWAQDKSPQAYRNQSIWGDLAQPFRGLVNMGKGISRFVRGVTTLFPLRWYVRGGGTLTNKAGSTLMIDDNFGDAFDATLDNSFKTVNEKPLSPLSIFLEGGKALLSDLINGPLLFLRGALQLVTTPLTYLFRIPLRLAITEGVNNYQKYGEYNRNDESEKRIVNKLPPFLRIKANFKGTLAPYLKDSLLEDIFWDFIQPLRGLWNITKGVITLPISLLRMVFSPLEALIKYMFSGCSPEETFREVGEWLSYSFGSLSHGILQIATTPLEWFIRMPLRGIISYHLWGNTNYDPEQVTECEYGDYSTCFTDSRDDSDTGFFKAQYKKFFPEVGLSSKHPTNQNKLEF